ncbi:DNA cytosine methyltransferase [Rufibacter immobilis]|uniref:DNA cytosine methyltransferase n=1 Tax=Rufibacter immobilis TaxID=1348778 RepID=UPI0035EFDD9C
MIGIDLFSGAGGMTLGAKQAGINVQFAVEYDKHAGQTYKYNNDDVELFNDDIRKLTNLPINREKGVPLVVFGGPPCQGFSTSNQRTRSTENSNNWLYKEFFRVVKMCDPLPDWIVFENVKGFSDTENGIFLNKVFLELEDLGYTVTSVVLNAADFGVPQRRNRFFAIASLHNKKVDFEKYKVKRPVTVKCAISDLPDLEVGSSEIWKKYKHNNCSEYARTLRGKLKESPNHQVSKNSDLVLKRYEHIPQGGNWQHIPEILMQNYKDRTRCHTGIYHRLKENEPSIVIGNYRKNMLVHPIQNRGLSVREAARLQSFPDWFEFKGSIGFQQQQVGNAVPPMLAKVIFEAIVNN